MAKVKHASTRLSSSQAGVLSQASAEQYAKSRVCREKPDPAEPGTKKRTSLEGAAPPAPIMLLMAPHMFVTPIPDCVGSRITVFAGMGGRGWG